MVLHDRAFRRLCLARDLLTEVPDEPLSIEEIAREAGMSSSHFTRQFEALFGTTPHQFRIQSRLERARLLLSRDDGSVTDICMALGFSSLGSFSTLFAQRVGVPPSRYRHRGRVVMTSPGPGLVAHTIGCLSLMAHLPPGAFRSFREA